MPMPRKSLAQHALAGTKPHDRASDTSHVPSGRPKIPRVIREAGLRAPFKQMCRLLSERRTLTNGDVELLATYVLIQDRYHRNVLLLKEEGELVTYFRLDSHGVSVPQVKKNLRHDIVTGAEKQMAAILNQLGLTPTSKDRAKPTTGTPDDEVVPGSMADLYPQLVKKDFVASREATASTPHVEPEVEEL